MAVCTLVHATANRPGAIAILQLIGDCGPVLRQLTGRADWQVHRARLVELGGIDEGLVVLLTNEIAQIMPHGGPRVVQRLMARLIELGAIVLDAGAIDLSQLQQTDPLRLYPEASDAYEALALLGLARAASPLAIDLLLDQPRRWRAFTNLRGRLTPGDLARSRRLNRLIDPPLVVLAGPPNVGKSTLSNALLGRAMSIALDYPGTTRDYTAGRIDLAGLVVDWHDTPGIRGRVRGSGEGSVDAIEQKAVELAWRLMERADLLIAMTDANHDWPAPAPPMPRSPDLLVVNKVDLMAPAARLALSNRISAGTAADGPPTPRLLAVSAVTGEGIAELVSTVRDLLVKPADILDEAPWVFDERLLTLAVGG